MISSLLKNKRLLSSLPRLNCPLGSLLSRSSGRRDVHSDPVEIKLRTIARRLEVTFEDGKSFSYSAEFLRVKSLSADNERGTGRVLSGRRHVGIMRLEPVGNYAIRLFFDDLHQAGIYTWPYLYDLGLNKLSHSRRYIQALKDKGLSREPSRPVKKTKTAPCATGHKHIHTCA